MSDKQKKNLIMGIALAQLVAAVAIMIFGVLNKQMSTLQSNILMGGALFLYWFLMDVVDACARHQLDGISQERKSAYFRFAFLDFAGLAGIAIFLFSIGGGNSYGLFGAILYAFTMKPKRESQEIFYGKKKPEEEELPAEETTWVTAATRKAAEELPDPEDENSGTEKE